VKQDNEKDLEMTPQEQDMIGSLIDRVQKTQLAEKDMDAEQMLQQGLGRNPDALYILAQTVLVQKYALEQAQAQLTQAKAQIDQMQQHPEPKHASSFLGGLLGRNDAPTPPPPPPPQTAQGYAPVPVQSYPQYAPVGGGYGAPMGMGGGGGFLQGALQTAAGVAAGALAFEGVESLMHGFGHAAGYGGGESLGSFDGGQRPEVVNNYYGDAGDRGGHDASAAERSEGDREDRDYGSDRSSDDRNDLLSGSGDDSGSGFNDSGSNDLDDSSFDDGGGDFGDDGSGGGGDDSNFA
jgi:hypothetical protein